MSRYEYIAIPAPARGEKAKGAKSAIERFAATLSDALNDMARDGWEYVRAETLPAEERSGLTSRSTTYHNLLVFRRAVAAQPAQTPRPEDAKAPPPEPAAPSIPTAEATPVRAPFTQPMRAMQKPQPQPRSAEPPLTAPPQPPAPSGPRLGPATR